MPGYFQESLRDWLFSTADPAINRRAIAGGPAGTANKKELGHNLFEVEGIIINLPKVAQKRQPSALLHNLVEVAGETGPGARRQTNRNRA
jgi:hypothetical protein